MYHTSYAHFKLGAELVEWNWGERGVRGRWEMETKKGGWECERGEKTMRTENQHGNRESEWETKRECENQNGGNRES